ncbi:DNA replication/repair protein RecF [Porticoccaceae bacterium]|nr:DNA replication/repair protein RecF [Porticoccaceae bacterium]
MHISRLDLFALRNLADVRLQCNPHSNILYGQNGSGKTSLLEGLSLLSRARSFRQRDSKTLINYQAQELVVSARCEPASAEFVQTYTLGIKRPRTGSAQARCNGQPVASALDLSSLLPLQIIEPQSFSLLEGGPLQRRQFIDWGVFHVEQGYKAHWRAYQRGLKQRNELLRRGRISDELLAPWSAIVAEHGTALGCFREDYLAVLAPLVTEQLSRYGALGDVTLAYQPGWSVEYANLLEALVASQDRDRRRGMTTVGPHRGELRVLVAGRVASEVLSRGEIKLLVYALKLAQAQFYAKKCGEPCVLAIDDLPAELDYRHRGEVLAAVAALKGQSFITGVDRADFSPFHREIGSASMFHVEHGAVTAEKDAA